MLRPALQTPWRRDPDAIDNAASAIMDEIANTSGKMSPESYNDILNQHLGIAQTKKDLGDFLAALSLASSTQLAGIDVSDREDVRENAKVIMLDCYQRICNMLD